MSEQHELNAARQALAEAIRCADCGAVIYLDVLQAGTVMMSVWSDYRGGTSHFTGGLPLMAPHRIELEEAAEQ